MGYRIIYSPEDNAKYPTNNPKKGNIKLIPMVFLLVVLLLVGSLGIRSKLMDWLIPGDPHVTKAAFAMLVDELRDGAPFADAVTTFCNEIIACGKTQTIFNT